MDTTNDETRKQRVAALVAEIATAFDGVQREDGITLHEAIGFDDYEYSDAERAANRAKDTEPRWQDIPAGWVGPVLYYFDPKGFQFHIPALMLWVLMEREAGDLDTHIENFLDQDFHSEKGLRYLPLVSILTTAQAKAVAHYLQWLSDETEQTLADAPLPPDDREASVVAQDIWDIIEEHGGGMRQVIGFQSELSDPLGESWKERFIKKMEDTARDWTPNPAQRALERYWGQFL